MPTLLSKVRGITKSTSAITTDDQVVNFLQAGSNYLTFSVPPFMLWFLAEKSTAITDGNGYTMQNTNLIFSVERNGKIADKVPLELANQISYPDSLFYATKFFPKYYIHANKVFIKPDPIVGEPGYVVYIKPPKITQTTDSDSINYSSVENIIVNYACALDFTAMANYYSKKTIDDASESTSDVQSALDKAKTLIDGSTNDAIDWIAEEDAEMASVTINAAQEEVNRALAEVNAGQILSKEAQMYYEKAKMYFDMANLEIKQYVGSNPEMMAMQAQLIQQQGGRR